MIRLVCVGTIKERFFKEACEEYRNRIKRWIKIDEIEVTEEDENRYHNINLLLEKEATKIEKHIKDGQYVAVFDIRGKKFDSMQFSDFLKDKISNNLDIIFIIGGSSGLSESIKNRANILISFSDLTFPHQLFRVIVYEQIYRSLSIINRTKYHK